MSSRDDRLHLALQAQGGTGWLGGAYYIGNLCQALLSLPPGERQALHITLMADAGQLAALSNVTPRVDAVVDTGCSAPVGFWDRQRYRLMRVGRRERMPWFDDHMGRLGVDLLFPFTPPDASPRSYAAAAWMPDFQHREMPDMFSAAEVDERDAAFVRAIRFADAIVLSSESAREHCRRHFPQALPMVHTLPFASSVDAADLDGPACADTVARLNLPDRFFMCSNQFWRHKNHSVVIEALALLRQRGVKPVVAFSGHTHDYRSTGHFDAWLGGVHRAGVWDEVRILGILPRREQLALLRASIGVVQPSRFEGWSTVVEDARALGCPMLLSDIAVHREQDPPDSAFFGADDPVALARLLEQRWLMPDDQAATHQRWQAAEKAQAARVEAFGRGFLGLALNIARRAA